MISQTELKANQQQTEPTEFYLQFRHLVIPYVLQCPCPLGSFSGLSGFSVSVSPYVGVSVCLCVSLSFTHTWPTSTLAHGSQLKLIHGHLRLQTVWGHGPQSLLPLSILEGPPWTFMAGSYISFPFWFLTTFKTRSYVSYYHYLFIMQRNLTLSIISIW